MKYLNTRAMREKLSGRSREAIANDVKAGFLPAPIKIGGRNFWIESEVDSHLQKLAEKQAA